MIVLLGGSGFVGNAYQRFFQKRGVACVNLRRPELDYTNRPVLEAFLARERPAFLLNTAGYTGKPNVDACEAHKTECLAGNALLPGTIRQACEATGVPWGHISSGCIFLGARADGSGFTEEDEPNFTFRRNNCSFYSGCKALGEEVLSGAERCYLWRLRIPFNHIHNPRNYLSKLMSYERLLDVRNSLSQLDEFVRATWECWERRLPFGVYNCTNPGSITTREAVDLIQQSGLVKKEFKFFESEAEFMQKAAVTPRSNCVLDSSKLARSGIHLTEVHDAVREALRSWQW